MLEHLGILGYSMIYFMYIMSDNPTGVSQFSVEMPDNQQGRAFSSNSRGKLPSETTCRIPHMSVELAQLLGLLFTDGCVSPKGKSTWRIYFAVKSEKLIEVFKNSMIQLFGLDESRVRIGMTQDDLIRAIVDSKEIGDWLTNTFGTFRTLKRENGLLPDTKLPVAMLEASDQTAAFLRSAFSCDGGVSLYTATRNAKRGQTIWLIRTVFLACAHPALRKDYLKLLNSLGIQAREIEADGKIKIENSKDINLFAEKIGFIPGVQVTGHSKYWHGWEKNKVLEHMISSYGNPSSIYNLPQFVR